MNVVNGFCIKQVIDQEDRGHSEIHFQSRMLIFERCKIHKLEDCVIRCRREWNEHISRMDKAILMCVLKNTVQNPSE